MSKSPLNDSPSASARAQTLCRLSFIALFYLSSKHSPAALPSKRLTAMNCATQNSWRYSAWRFQRQSIVCVTFFPNLNWTTARHHYPVKLHQVWIKCILAPLFLDEDKHEQDQRPINCNLNNIRSSYRWNQFSVICATESTTERLITSNNRKNKWNGSNNKCGHLLLPTSITLVEAIGYIIFTFGPRNRRQRGREQ